MRFDFTHEKSAQDMLCILARDEQCTYEEALKKIVNKANGFKILHIEWLPIAHANWGHDDPNREWMRMEDPVVDVDLCETQIGDIEGVQLYLLRMWDYSDHVNGVTAATAATMFMLLRLGELGYHL